MPVTRCNRAIEQTNGTCYHMSFISNKKMYGVYCMLVKKKLCPFHPKYKEYKDVDTK